MRTATRLTVSTFGVLAGIAGVEHGIGETLQGPAPPAGLVIESWAGSELFRVLGGEPAMTLIPSLALSGVLSILLSLVLLVWFALPIERERGGWEFILLSLALLLVGGGFGPPTLGLILGVTLLIDAGLTSRHAHLSPGLQRVLSALWPWSYGAALAAWLFLFPGSILLDHFVGVSNPDLVVGVAALSAFALLGLTIVTALARDHAASTRAPGTLAASG